MDEHTSIEPSALSEVVKDVWSVVKKVVAYRKQKRLESYDRVIAPITNTLLQSHKDFLDFYRVAFNVVEPILLKLQENPKDISPLAEELQKSISDLREIRDRSRVERRIAFEEIVWRKQKMEKPSQASNKILKSAELSNFLSEDEIILLGDFFSAYAAYFQDQDNEYSHDLDSHIGALSAICSLIMRHNVDHHERIVLELERFLREIKEWEEKRSAFWSVFSRTFTRLEADLS